MKTVEQVAFRYIFGEAQHVQRGGTNAPVVVHSQINVRKSAMLPVILPKLFTVDECALIIGLGANLHNHNALIDSGNARDLARSAELSWIPMTERSEWIYERIAGAFESINHSAYGFSLSGMIDPLQFSAYAQGDHFDWHIDAGADITAARKLSVTVQLSGEDAYSGGNLEFHGGAAMPSARMTGTAVVFPAFLAHRVTPVLAGIRYSLVGWASGDPFV
jgi:PKHD-type hydroxylase